MYLLIYCILKGILCYITLYSIYYVKAWTNLIYRFRLSRLIFRAHNYTRAPDQASKKRARETNVYLQTRNNCIVLCYLLPR